MKNLNKIKILIISVIVIYVFGIAIYALENPDQLPPYSKLNFQTQSKWLIFPRLTKFINDIILNNSKLGIGLSSPTALFHLKSIDNSIVPFQIESYNPNFFNPNLFPGWSYRRPITVDNTQNTSTLTDYQVLINLDTQTLIAQNKMRSDCGDIRFTDSDGSTELNYWLESDCNTTSTPIWVKIPSIPSSSLKTIYVYYGNSNATSQSNPNNMGFIFFDDFEDGTIDSNKWRIIGSSTLVTETNGYLRTYSENNGWQAVRSVVSFSGSNQILMRAYIYGDRGNQGNIFLGFISSTAVDPTDSLEGGGSPARIGITEREVYNAWPIVALQANGNNMINQDLFGIGIGPLVYNLVRISWYNTFSNFYLTDQVNTASATLNLYPPTNITFNLLLGGLDNRSGYGHIETRIYWIVVRNNFSQFEPTVTMDIEEQSNTQFIPSLYLSTSSNLGLLTSNPGSTLSVNGNVSIGYPTISAPNYGLVVLGKVGIGTTSPLASLEVANRNDVILAGGRYGINIETLSGNKTLNPRTDKIYQYLNPNNANRIIYLSTTTAQQGDRFVIKNTAPYTSSNRLQINVGSSQIYVKIPANSMIELDFEDNTWRSVFYHPGGSYDYAGISYGYNARVYSKSRAIGYNADAYNFGLAIGYNADGENHGTAIGYNTNATSSGTAIGYNAQAFKGGTAVGYETRAYNYGVSVGYYSGYNLSSTTINQNVLLGAFSGYQLTTGIGNIILGYQSGYNTTTSPTTGSYNILIGYQAGTPANDTSNFLNIGNLIFATGINTATGSSISNGKVGIGTISPTALLHLKGQTGYDQLRLETSYTPSGTNDSNGNIGDITWDDNYIYIKTSGGWKRKALSNF